jgi:hypothetical protein
VAREGILLTPTIGLGWTPRDDEPQPPSASSTLRRASKARISPSWREPLAQGVEQLSEAALDQVELAPGDGDRALGSCWRCVQGRRDRDLGARWRTDQNHGTHGRFERLDRDAAEHPTREAAAAAGRHHDQPGALLVGGRGDGAGRVAHRRPGAHRQPVSAEVGRLVLEVAPCGTQFGAGERVLPCFALVGLERRVGLDRLD